MSGLVSGTGEVISEAMFGGYKFGGKTLTDYASKGIEKYLGNKLLGTLAKLGFNTVGEGVEELVAGWISALGKKFTYMSDKEIKEIFTKEEAWDSFISGMALGGFFEGAKMINSYANPNAKNYVTERSKSEQRIFDEIYNERIADAEKADGKVTSATKDEIYEEVEKYISKGYVETDFIESKLGGKKYEAYIELEQKANSILNEINKIADSESKQQDLTKAQQKKLDDLKKEWNDILPKIKDAKLDLMREVSSKVKNTNLIESYRELERSAHDFEIDLESVTNENARKTVENFIEIAKRKGYGNTNKAHDFLELCMRASEDRGHIFRFVDAEEMANIVASDPKHKDAEGKTVEGFLDEETNEIYINMDADKWLNSLVGHEIMHGLEKTSAYENLAKALVNHSVKKGEYNRRLESVKGRYAEKDVDFELHADLLGDYIFNDSDFVKSLAKENPTGFKKALEELKYFAKIATAGSQQKRELEKAKREFAQAWRERQGANKDASATETEGTDSNASKELAISYESLVSKPDMKVSQVTTSVDDVMHKSRDEIATEARAKLSKTNSVNGVIKIHNDDTKMDIVVGKQGLEHGLDRNYEYTARILMHLDSYLKNAIKINEAEADEGRGHDSDILLGYGETPTGEKIPAYFVVSKLQTGLVELIEFGSLYSVRATKIAEDFTQGDPSFQARTSAEISISDLLDIVNDVYSDVLPKTVAEHYGHERRKTKLGGSMKYSISDSNGKELTKGQQDYFKNSKVRDENGNLKVMYHGTRGYGFTVFDYHTQKFGLFGNGFYFTDDNSVAEGYSKNKRGEFVDGSGTYKCYLNIKNPIDMDAIADKDRWVTEIANALGESEAYVRGFINADEGVKNSDMFNVMKEVFYDYEIIKWEAEEMAQDIIRNMGYDGITHIGGGRYNKADTNRHRVYIAFDQEQIKNTTNENPTKDADIRYSYSSISDSFGDGKLTIGDFRNGKYKETDGYKSYVDECVNNYRQTRGTKFDETLARKEIETSIDGIVRVAIASKEAGYDILDSKEKRTLRDSKKRLLFSSLEPNSEYTTSNDISTICDKSKNMTEIYDAIVRLETERGVPKSKRFFNNVDNYFYLHKVLADKGLTQPCRQCYVDSMRKNLTPMANAFLELIGETDENNKANGQLYQLKGKDKGKVKSNNAKIRKGVLDALEEYGMSATDITHDTLTTEEGLAQLRIQAPLVYEAFNSFYGQSKPKMPKKATPFRFGELTALLTDDKGRINESLVNKINSTGGFRLQSYSDFQIQNFVDVLQVIHEAGTLGLSGHAYTKVPAFLDATKGTNLKRNISVFMYNDNGEWKIDRNDSFPYTLEEIYKIVEDDKSGNTGIIAVTQNADT